MNESKSEYDFLKKQVDELGQELACKNTELNRVREELIHERKLHRDARLTSESEKNKFQVLIEGLTFMGIGINIIDENHTILFQNSVMDNSFGEITSQDCFKKYTTNENPCDVCLFRRAIAGKAVIRSILSAKDGRDYELLAAPLEHRDGMTAQAIGVFINVMERKKAEELKKQLEARLQRSQKLEAIGILAGGVAHDLNNILAALVGYPDLILNDLPPDSPLREPILAMKDSGQRAAIVVQDLLALSRQGFIHTEVLNFNNIINDYLNSIEHSKVLSRKPEIKFEINLGNELLNVSGSAIHLSKVVINLVTNAADAIDGAGTISIATRNSYIDRIKVGYEHIGQGEYVVLSVKDTGRGIAGEELEHIFEPFYTKKLHSRGGGGLGLAVVWGTMKDHHGYVNVVTSPEEGTLFEMYFPVTRKVTALSEPWISSLEDFKGNGEKILVVDDISEQRDIASKILSRLGYFVVTVSDGEEGIDYVRKYPVDLVVIDMIMDPGIDGLDTYKGILKANPTQKAIIVSGYSKTDRVKQAQALGAVEYVRKPYTIDILGAAVMRELERKR